MLISFESQILLLFGLIIKYETTQYTAHAHKYIERDYKCPMRSETLKQMMCDSFFYSQNDK